MATETFSNNASSTLSMSVDNVVTLLSVVDGSSFPSSGQFRLKINNELMLCISRFGDNLVVARAQEGTSAASHASGDAVVHIVTAAALTQLKWEAGSIEDSIISPTSLSGSVDNYNPTGLSMARHIRQSCSSASTLTGLAAQESGQRIVVHNVSTSAPNTLTLNHEDTNSTALNRFTLPGLTNVTLPTGGSVELWYDGVSTRWRVASVGTALATTTGTGFATVTGGVQDPTALAFPLPTSKGGTGLTAIGTAYQMLRVNSGSTALEFGATDLSTAGVTGVLPSANAPSHSGDVTGTHASTVVGKVNGASVPSAGSLTTGNSLRVSGASTLNYSALNLAGGSGWVTGTLPVTNGGTGLSALGSGVATWLGVPSSANLATVVSDSTGSGALVFGTSPQLTTPVVGSGGLLISSPSITNKYTILGGAIAAPRTVTLPLLAGNDIFVTADFAQTLTNKVISGASNTLTIRLANDVTGTLPIANGGTGLSALGSGVATWLGTPSSANLATAVTDSTGGGGLVFATSPQLTTPVIGSAGFLLAGSTITNKYTIVGGAIAAPRTVTMPLLGADDIFVTADFAQTLTNKVISGASNTLTIRLASDVTGTLPVTSGGTGLSALGSGVATWLGAPSGANLASALTSALPTSKGGTGLTTIGTALQALRVNSGATGLEFATVPTWSASSRITALDANHIHAWELTDTSGATAFADTGSSGTPVSLTISNTANIQLEAVGLLGNCAVFGVTSTGGSGTNVFASALTSAFTDLPSTTITVEYWILPNAGLGASSIFPFAWVTGAGSQYFSFGLGTTSGDQFQVRFQSSGGSVNGNTNATAMVSSKVSTNWTYLAMSYDGATVKLYVNGELMFSSAASGTILTASTPSIKIGFDGSGNPYVGKMSRVRMSNIARSQTYIRSVYRTAMAY